MANKIRIAVLYGGRSGEHEISLRSGAFVIQNLDRTRYEVIPVSIDKSGRWQWNDLKLIENSNALPIFKNAPEMRLATQNNGRVSLEPLGAKAESLKDIDVFFPVMHGPLCEDGTMQGLLELADVAYVGSGVLGSAVCMDKDVAKRLAAAAGIPIVPYICLRKADFAHDPAGAIAKVKEALVLPIFVKPANLGSSVGIHKVKQWAQLESCLRDAFQYDNKVLVENGINAREIELAALEERRGPPFISVPCEIQPSAKHEFYSYEAKYLDENGAHFDLPAKLNPPMMARVKELASKVFRTLECAGMARIDFFLDRDTNEFYFNEVNTIPGFTSISMYPRMMAESGIGAQELLNRLVELAQNRHSERHGLKRDFTTP